MVRRLLISALPVFAAAPAQPARIAAEQTAYLEQVIAFADPAQCSADPLLRRLAGEMSWFDEANEIIRVGEPVVLPGLGRIEPRIVEVSDAWFRALLPVSGPWHGLTLLRIENVAGIESGPNNLHLVFAEPPAAALPILNRIGFDLPGIGAARLIDEEIVEVSVGLYPRGEGSELVCFVDQCGPAVRARRLQLLGARRRSVQPWGRSAAGPAADSGVGRTRWATHYLGGAAVHWRRGRASDAGEAPPGLDASFRWHDDSERAGEHPIIRG